MDQPTVDDGEVRRGGSVAVDKSNGSISWCDIQSNKVIPILIL